MYCGLPIISTNVGGQTDFLEDGKTGFFVKPKAVRELANAIVKLQNGKTLAEKMSAYNRKRVRDFYITKVARRFEKIYVSFIKRDVELLS